MLFKGGNRLNTLLGAIVSVLSMVLLLGIGIILTLRSRFFQLRGIRYIYKNTLGTLLTKQETAPKARSISPFQAMTTALAGTMGVGNIAGVATALVAGGAGAVFWMWLSALFGMMTKYAEIFLSVKYRRKSKDGAFFGGPMYYMEKCPGKRGLACVFAALCALASFGVGNLTQVNSVCTAMYSAFSVPQMLSGAAVAVAVALVIFGGVRRIATVTETVIPFLSILYICTSGAFLYIHRTAIPSALLLIVRGAFAPAPAAGGVTGYAVSQAVHIGLSRGVFTNEAGLGSAPIAHAAADCKSPVQQGVWGILEVFLDTIVVCTITALVVLCADSGRLWQSGLDGAPLTSAAFASAFGTFGSRFIAFSIIFFAIAAMLGWCYYGEQALSYLFKGKAGAVLLYRLLFVSAILLGAHIELTLVWRVSDILNALMALPNVLALWWLRREVYLPKARPSLHGKSAPKRPVIFRWRTISRR